jgi:prepilin-type N-terminal cleavage/methylation domain-containing protein
MSRDGLTLIEVLLAVVLLAIVAAAVAPYPRASPQSELSETTSFFSVEVRQSLAVVERSHSEHPTLEDVLPALVSIGATCTLISERSTTLDGRWVVITRGPQRTLYWVREPHSDSVRP